MLLEEVQAIYPDAKEAGDGAIHFECPICHAEGHPGKDFTIFANRATSCVRAAAAGPDFNREHCRPVRDQIGLGKETSPAWLTEPLFEGRLTLQCAVSKKERVLTVATNCDKTLARNEINLNRADHRAEFVKSIDGFDSESERVEINHAMLRLADRRESVKSVIQESEAEATECVIFKELPDGRLIEQLHGGIFAVYDGSAVEYKSNVECEGITYNPITGDPCIEDNDLHLPGRLTEYGEERLLDEEIETYLAKFCDAPARELKFAAKLIRLTYIQDRLIEVPYLHIVGPSGSGKTRMSDVVGMACHLPYLIVEGSAASTFRISDRYGVTMCFDEFNPQVDSEDQQALIQILNAGFQRRRKVPRVEKGPNGEFVTRSFRPFGIKIFSGLKLTGSYAFQRRTIPIQLSVTKNPKIPYCDDGTIDVLSEPLREKLTLWRLRNLKRDYRSLIRKTEAIFKAKEIMPGFIQIGVPLAMLIEDKGLQGEFISTMETRTTDAAEDRRESFDGRLVALVHGRIFDIDDEGKAQWKVKGDLPVLEDGKPCEALRVELLTEIINEGVHERKKVEARGFGKTLRGVGFKTKEIKSRESAYRYKTAVVYDPATFARVFNSFSLPTPADFNPPNPPKTDKPKQDNEMQVGGLTSDEPISETQSPQSISLQEQDLEQVGGLGGLDSQEDSAEAVSTIVALDVETEPFNKKRGITPRNTPMIGLALSHDGAEKTNYETDPGAWQMLMPEPEQTVIFHHAKFDLGVLKRTGLPTPEKWEDTMIAAHLLCETGEHGLKPLAKEHLDVENPLTFEEAERMRLIDPPVFEEYARNDARYTYRLWQKFEPEIDRQELRRVYELEKSVVPVVMAMEDRGMLIDVAALKQADVELKERLAELKTGIRDLVGYEFKINSPKVLATVLTEGLGLKLQKTTKKGQPSVDAESLEGLAGQHPVIPLLIEYRELDKLASAFISEMPKKADKDGRVHPTFKQLGPTSGRFSCSDPNVQQLPRSSGAAKVLRSAFISGPGRKLVVADWSQVELRIIAHYSKDSAMNKAFADGADLHTRTASLMFRVSESGVTKDQRGAAKAINFGLSYGMGAPGLFKSLNAAGIKTTLDECKNFIAAYRRSYPGIPRLLDSIQKAAKERGYVKTLFGRHRRLDADGGNELSVKNAVIQGSGADIAKDAMVRLHAALPSGSHLIAMIHDEFVVECDAEQAEEVRALMVEIMSKQPDGFTVPLLVEAKIADNWGDAK